MFKNFRNNYYFGKAGQGDLTPEDMPTTRSQLFSVTLRTRLPQLIRLNVVYALIWIPTLIVLWLIGSVLLNVLGKYFGAAESAEAAAAVNPANFWPEIYGAVDFGLLLLFPCIAITGPFTAGVSYVCRNWSRDEHAFVWSDFKDAVKENWKQALGVSVITGMVPVAVFIGVRTYHNFAMTNWIFIIPEAIVALFGVLWALSVTYMYPLMVSYELSFKNLLRNAFMLGVARLPMSVAVRLLHCVPLLIFAAVLWFSGLSMTVLSWGPMVLVLWYGLLGLALSRFVTASYTNAVFDRFINSRIEGAKVNRGLYQEEDVGEPEETQEQTEQKDVH